MQAEELDIELQKYAMELPDDGQLGEDHELWELSLSSWSYYYKLRQMEWIVQLGFELRIYQDRELAGMYWSVGRYLPISPQFINVHSKQGICESSSASELINLNVSIHSLLVEEIKFDTLTPVNGWHSTILYPSWSSLLQKLRPPTPLLMPSSW